MTARSERARLLADELERAIEALATEATTRAALVFLDRLARLEALPAVERREAGIDELVAAARRARDAEAERLGERAGAGLDLEGLGDRALAVARGEADAAEWAWDALLVAAVVPDLPDAIAARADACLAHVAGIAAAEPDAFAGAAAVARERLALESPRRIASIAFEPLFETLLAGDEAAAPIPAPAVRPTDRLRRILADVAAGRGTLATPEDLADTARALDAARRSTDRVAALLRPRRSAGAADLRPGREEDAPRLALAARGLPGLPEHALLRRLPEGELLLVRRDEGPSLEWYGAGAPELALHADGEAVPLSAIAVDGGIRFPLPVERLDPASHVALAIGPHRLSIPLPAPDADVAFEASPFVAHLREVEEWLPLAPVTAADELRRLRDDPAATAPIRAAIDRLLERRGPPVAPAGCAFPVIPVGDAPPWLHGAVLRAAVHPGRLLPSGALDAALAFPTEAGLRRLLAGLAARTGEATLAVAPNPALAPALGLTLAGDSCGAAFAVAAEAARREVPVPDDAVVSAALVPGPGDALLLAPVAGIDAKRRLLERERPRCRFFFVADPVEPVGPSDAITLVPLPPGPVDALFERLLPAPPPERRFEALRGQLQAADARFAAQRYDEAGAAYRDALSSLARLEVDPSHDELLRWRFLATTRLGASELHAGDPVAAERWFDEARRLADRHPGLPRVAAAELAVGAAEALVDSFRPDAAEAILLPLEAEWRRRVADEDGVERRMALVGILATRHRVALLRGEPDRAVGLEDEVVKLCPLGERARALGDLGEALRRAGRLDDALVASRHGFDALGDMLLETYRRQTRAFLTFHAGRLALDRGEPPPPAEELAAVTSGLPERSAARWRLEALAGLSRLSRGDAGGLDALIGQLDAAPTPFVRWHLALGLLGVAGLAPDHAGRARQAATAALAGLRDLVSEHRPLADALASFLAAAARGERDPDAEATLLRLRAY